MEAKDTVMSPEIVSPKFPDYIPCAVWDVLGAQAELTWKAREPEIAEAHKAGYNQAREEMNLQTASLADMLLTQRQEGRKDVVEWIERNHDYKIVIGGIYIPSTLWQAQKKDWGLE